MRRPLPEVPGRHCRRCPEGLSGRAVLRSNFLRGSGGAAVRGRVGRSASGVCGGGLRGRRLRSAGPKGGAYGIIPNFFLSLGANNLLRMTLNDMQAVLRRLAAWADGWEAAGAVAPIERDLALEKLRMLYEALQTGIAVAEPAPASVPAPEKPVSGATPRPVPEVLYGADCAASGDPARGVQQPVAELLRPAGEPDAAVTECRAAEVPEECAAQEAEDRPAAEAPSYAVAASDAPVAEASEVSADASEVSEAEEPAAEPSEAGVAQASDGSAAEAAAPEAAPGETECAAEPENPERPGVPENPGHVAEPEPPVSRFFAGERVPVPEEAAGAEAERMRRRQKQRLLLSLYDDVPEAADEVRPVCVPEESEKPEAVELSDASASGSSGDEWVVIEVDAGPEAPQEGVGMEERTDDPAAVTCGEPAEAPVAEVPQTVGERCGVCEDGPRPADVPGGAGAVSEAGEENGRQEASRSVGSGAHDAAASSLGDAGDELVIEEIEILDDEPVRGEAGAPHAAGARVEAAMRDAAGESEAAVLGDVLNHDVRTLADTIAAPRDAASELARGEAVTDLRAAIGLNDKFLLIRDLFGGDSVQYERTIDALNACADLDDCIVYIAENHVWNPSSDGAKRLIELLERKFS